MTGTNPRCLTSHSTGRVANSVHVALLYIAPPTSWEFCQLRQLKVLDLVGKL